MFYLYQLPVINALIAAQEFTAAIPLIDLCSEKDQLNAYKNLYLAGEKDLAVKNVKKLGDYTKQKFCQHLLDQSYLEKHPDLQLSSCKSLVRVGSEIHALAHTAHSIEIYQHVVEIAQTIESTTFLDQLSTFFSKNGMINLAGKVHESDLS